MKLKKLLWLGVLAFGSWTFFGCDDDDPIHVPEEVRTAMSSKYPDALNVHWEMEKGYYVADFRRSDLSGEAEAWFTPAGVWQWTETDVVYGTLPQTVRTAFEASDYATWYVDDADVLERPDKDTLYVLEVESWNVEQHLYIAVDGTIFTALPV